MLMVSGNKMVVTLMVKLQKIGPVMVYLDQITADPLQLAPVGTIAMAKILAIFVFIS